MGCIDMNPIIFLHGIKQCRECPFRQEYVICVDSNGKIFELPKCRGRIVLSVKKKCEYRSLMR